MISTFIVLVVAVGAVWYFFDKNKKSIDVNKDGKVDVADAMAAVEEVVEEVKAEVKKVEEAVVADVKAAVEEVVEEVKKVEEAVVADAKAAVEEVVEEVKAKKNG